MAHEINGGPKVAPAGADPWGRGSGVPGMVLPDAVLGLAPTPEGLVVMLQNGIAQMVSRPLSPAGLTELIDALTAHRRELSGLVAPGAGRLVVPGSD